MKKISTLSLSLLLCFTMWLLLLPVLAATPVNLAGDFSLSITIISGEDLEGDPIVSSYVMGSEYDYGVEVNVNFETLADESEEFVFFLNDGQVSTSPTANFLVTSDTEILAFIKPVGQVLAIFVDSNGAVIDGDYMSGSGTPSIPSSLPNKPGYQVNATTPWTPAVSSISVDTVYHINYELINFESTVDITVDGNTTAYPYNSIVTLDASLDENFTHWEENGVIVSYNPIYMFSAINDRNITKETDGGSAQPVLYLQEVAIRENHTSYLAQINLPAGYEILEYGLVGSNTEVGGQYEPEISDPDVTIIKSNVMHTTTNEFLRSMDENTGFVYTRAYAIIKQDSTISVIYSLVRNSIILNYELVFSWGYNNPPSDESLGAYVRGTFNGWGLTKMTSQNFEVDKTKFSLVVTHTFIGTESVVEFKFYQVVPGEWNPEHGWILGSDVDPNLRYKWYGDGASNLIKTINPADGPQQNALASPYSGY